VIAGMSWVLAELVRHFHRVSSDEAQKVIDELVAKQVPAIQVFDGCPRLLKQLPASDHALVLLYWRSPDVTSIADLSRWMRPTMVKNLTRTLRGLNERDLVHQSPDGYRITYRGEHSVEVRKLLETA
jgi:hypothetical protein